ncbi:placenta-specific protein 9 isoform X2 [Arvicanthis niloticus]|uniref:placenta-specific protein 9 isoform X2 n=1 Tax=Arvicanthis niloticus TaxID=61156 RepID=UPI001486DB46|nr:placenta-specific protein 9 isoform X1 [Arvicanthis niloticus]
MDSEVEPGASFPTSVPGPQGQSTVPASRGQAFPKGSVTSNASDRPTAVQVQNQDADTSVSELVVPAAEFPSSPGEDLAWSPGCDRHMAVQSRLDIMEETVEKTVEHLEAEVTSLLGLLEELAPNLPPGPFSSKPDLLGDDGF